MIGVKRDSRVERDIAAPAMPSVTTSTGATALEVAGLRERVDGMSMKLVEVDRRVGVLEAAGDDGSVPSQDDASGKPAAAIGPGDLHATEGSAGARDPVAPKPSRGPLHVTGVSGATLDWRADAHVQGPVPAPGPVILMLSDAQFQQWLGRGTPSAGAQGEHEVAEDDRHGDWRLGRKPSRTARSGRR